VVLTVFLEIMFIQLKLWVYYFSFC